MIEGPALILLHDGARGAFVATEATLDGGVLTARGFFRRVRVFCTRTWTMGEIREIRWEESNG